MTGPVLSAQAMRRIEEAAIAAGTTSGLALMEAAGRETVAAITATWPDTGPRKAVVLAGPGNNGGDGFVVARLLAAQGWHLQLFLLGDPARLPPDAGENARLWSAQHPIHQLEALPDPAITADLSSGMLVVDALFGTGLTRPVAGLGGLADGLAMPGLRRVAVDIPSGLHADSGARLGEAALPADLTVTFHAPKYGHFLGEGPAICGDLAVVDIGLGADPAPGAAMLAGAPPMAVIAKRDGHKYRHGHALILGGVSGHGGAARLAARAALRIGAGLVTLAPEPGAMVENAARCPDAVMLTPVAEAAALRAKLGDPRIGAVCIGPGLGLARARDLVPALLKDTRPAVLDADAISAFAERPAALLDLLHANVVLTPHEGEFARLFPDLAAGLADPLTSRADITREAARLAGATVLLKGPVTVIAAPDDRLALHPAVYHQAAPWLATAGAGDVLAGMITGLLARGLPAFEAACHACWLHAAAARTFGPGLTADDLPDALPRLLSDLSRDRTG